MAKKFNPIIRRRKTVVIPPEENLELAKQKARNWTEPGSGMPKGFEDMSEIGAIAWVHKNCKFAFVDERALDPDTLQKIQAFKTEVMKIDGAFDSIRQELKINSNEQTSVSQDTIVKIKQGIQPLMKLVNLGISIDRKVLNTFTRDIKELHQLQEQMRNFMDLIGSGTITDFQAPLRGRGPSGTDPKQVTLDLSRRLKSIENIESYGEYAKYLLAGFNLLLNLLTGQQAPQAAPQQTQIPAK